MKKNLMLLGSGALLLSIGFVACKKETVATPQNPASVIETSTTQQKAPLVVDFNYKLYTLTDNSGWPDYKCLKPKDDCSKVISKMTTSRDDQEKKLDDAIAMGNVADFFQNSLNWDELLPNLNEQKDWLDQLTSGNVTLVKKSDSGDGAILYIAISTSADPKNFKESDVAFATGILNE
jgi:hypothetical protein